MADVHNKETRSYNMSRIKNRNTAPELVVRKYLFSKGLRYRINKKSLPGKPDIVLTRYKTIIMINGCFWHKHDGCKYFVLPKTKTDWWLEKLNKTVARDKIVQKQLKDLNWKVIIVWECELKKDIREKTLKDLYEKITCQI